MSGLVLSLFPGVGLLDRGFEDEGFCIVRGPDLLGGGDIRSFHPPAGVFDGVIGGPPCQHFSQLNADPKLRRRAPNLIGEFARCVVAAAPRWYLMENVQRADHPTVAGYILQSRVVDYRRIDRGDGVGHEQSRVRRFDFGTADGRRLDLDPSFAALLNPIKEGCFTANGTQWEPARDRGNRRGRSRSTRTREELARGLRVQGLPPDFLADAPFTVEGKIRAVGNGVPYPLARAIAKAVRRAVSECAA